MPGRRILVVVLALGALAAGASAKPAPAGVKCSAAAAKKAILASPALRVLESTMRSGGGVDTLICHDLTRDGKVDMAASIYSGGTAGDIAWVVFRQAKGKWVLALRQLQLYKIGLFRMGGDLADSQPVYRQNDPNCCPSGGFNHRRFHWNGKTFAIVRRWHTTRFHP